MNCWRCWKDELQRNMNCRMAWQAEHMRLEKERGRGGMTEKAGMILRSF